MKYLIIDTTKMYLSNICIHVHLVINVPTEFQKKGYYRSPTQKKIIKVKILNRMF